MDSAVILRREFIAMLPAVIWSRRAWAQFAAADPPKFDPNDEAQYGAVYTPSQAEADWFESLKRPDIEEAMKRVDYQGGDVISCCDAGDAYPINILEDAYPPHTGIEENGFARVTDGKHRQIKKPDGSFKYREEITGPLSFHFSGNKITRELEGNPTKTAWAFLHVQAGNIDKVYCIVPIPPSM